MGASIKPKMIVLNVSSFDGDLWSPTRGVLTVGSL